MQGMHKVILLKEWSLQLFKDRGHLMHDVLSSKGWNGIQIGIQMKPLKSGRSSSVRLYNYICRLSLTPHNSALPVGI